MQLAVTMSEQMIWFIDFEQTQSSFFHRGTPMYLLEFSCALSKAFGGHCWMPSTASDIEACRIWRDLT